VKEHLNQRRLLQRGNPMGCIEPDGITTLGDSLVMTLQGSIYQALMQQQASHRASSCPKGDLFRKKVETKKSNSFLCTFLS